MSTQIGITLSDPYITPDPLIAPNSGTFTGPPGAGVLEVTLTTSLATAASPIVSGTTNLHAETYNGAIPGPTLRLTVGDTVIVRLINNLPYPTGIHWHGIELPNSADGTEVTQNGALGAPLQTLGNGVPAGGTFLYKFKVTRPGIFWYHPHHGNSANRVFRGLYGMIVVTDANENSLADGVVLPLPIDTKQIVLSDITVCKGNTVALNPSYDLTLPWAGPGGVLTLQPGETPANLCVTNAVNDDGTAPAVPAYAAGDVPSIMAPGVRINEGQTVLTNGVNVGARGGTPSAPAPVPLDATNYRLQVLSGQGLRLQIVNCATVRYFRLILTTNTGTQVPLVRVGGEGGLLDNAVVEGPVGTFDPKYTSGEILLPPSVRADVVATIPTGLTVGSVLTLWTQDFQRLEGSSPSGFVDIPTVPVMHLEVIAGAGTYSGISAGTPLRARGTFPGPLVADISTPPTTGVLLNPAAFVPPKPGDPTLFLPPAALSDIQLSSGTPSVNGIAGHALHGMPPDPEYPNTLHIGSSRYAAAVAGRILELTVTNMTSAHHPFHLHGFSMQPLLLAPRPGAPAPTPASTTGTLTWLYREFRDSINVPANYRLTFRVRLDDRPHVDGVTLDGWLGRWFFHCHIFFHHHRGMISEFVVTDINGKERPYVDVGGSWAYAPSGLSTTRKGTFYSIDGSYPVNLVASLFTPAGVAVPLTPAEATVTIDTAPIPGVPGKWSWPTPIRADGIYYAYITGTDSLGLQGQAVFRLKIGIVAGVGDDGSDNGDPHLHTVDGKAYDFQAAGEFIALRDRDGLEVQTRQTPVLTANPIEDSYTGLRSCVSLNTAVAARVGTHRISLQPGKEAGQFVFFVDGKQSRLTRQGLNLDGHRVSGFDVEGVMALRVDYLHHAVLIATPLLWTDHNLWFLNISISRTQADEGLMGSIPQNTWLPLLPSGASVGPMPDSLNERYITLYKTFADAWRLTDRSSLFVYEKGKSTSTFTDKDWPAGKPPCNLKPQFEIPGWSIPQGMDIEKAKQICQIITDEGLNKDCVFDVATTGEADFAKRYLITQQIMQRGTAVQIAVLEKGVITAVVSPLIGKQPKPKGTVVFNANNKETGQAIELDGSGRVQWKINGLNKGRYNIRAVFTPADTTVNYPSSSPNLNVTVLDDMMEDDGGMNKKIASFKIHPSIGIARLGNSPDEFFVGPEIPGECPTPKDGYKDSQGRMKKQAARFRIFGYDKKGKVVKEITAEDAQITWSVHLANKKSAWKKFDGLRENTPLRNAGIKRSQLEIDPGSRSLSSINTIAKFDTGKFMGREVPLGEMRMDNEGRLLVLGGFGKSSSTHDKEIHDFANNDHWHDDVSDGPVSAIIKLKGSDKTFNASGSWVICAPPDFAPSITNVITLYDTLLQEAVDKFGYKLPPKPSFVYGIRPILERANNMRWVCNLIEMHKAHEKEIESDSKGANSDQDNHHEDSDQDNHHQESPPHYSFYAAINNLIPAEARKAIFKKLRDPDSPPDLATEGSDMPMIHNDYNNEANQPLTRIQYKMMKNWMKGRFIDDRNDEIIIQNTINPEGLDRAALESCIGAAFYPGIEAGWMIRDTCKFIEPFRLDQSDLKAGDITKQLAVPWQADFHDCEQDGELAWWPAQRPDKVFLSDGRSGQVPWKRGYADNRELMVSNWYKLGFIINKGNSYVESERNP